MKSYHLVILYFLITGSLFVSCKDDDNNNDVAPRFAIDLDHIFSSEKFYLDSTYLNAINQELTPTTFKYYVSNFALIRSDNTEYVLPENYFLVNLENAASTTLQLNNVASGSYKAISFYIGVDSTKTVSGVQTGVLSPDSGMFWNQNDGYIFMKMEGTAPDVPGSNFTYHIGGYKEPNNNLRKVIFDFDGDIMSLAVNRNPEIHVMVDVQKLFYEPNVINFTIFPATVDTPGPDATIIADNYAQLFNFDHIHD